MRTSLLLIALAFLGACSDRSQPPQPSATSPAVPPARPASTQQAKPPEKGDVAAAEVTEPGEAVDPCDLSGYDMSKMTVDMHEDLVKACDRSKQ